MMSVMTSNNDGRVEAPPERVSSAIEEEKSAASTSGLGSLGGFGFGAVALGGEKAARVGGGGSDENKVSSNASDSKFLKLEHEEIRVSGSDGGVNEHSPTTCKLQGASREGSSPSRQIEHKKNMSTAEDYDSILSAFDHFAARGQEEGVGYGFRIGDMVWGKVKSHPWWPGHIFNEALASPSVRRGKHEGYVLVAFFGDSSYGWFDPEELILFEENFPEKSRQTTSRPFLKAVEEAADELARRSSLGLTCCCRNEYNLSPSDVDGYFVVDVGDGEVGVYSLAQIRNSQDNFRPRDVVSFLHEVAINSMSEESWTVDFIKQKAAALALRKVFFEDYDETYAQAFGTQQARPARPTAPLAVDLSKAPLSGRLVIAETLGKRKITVKHAKAKDQVVKDKYLLTRREESVQMKSKKASSSQVNHAPRLLSVDGNYGNKSHMHKASESSFSNDKQQPISQQASIDIKPSENSRKVVEGGTKKVKFLKEPAVKCTTDNAIRKKKKRRNGNSAETGGVCRDLPLIANDNTIAMKNVSGIPLTVRPTNSSGSEDQRIDIPVGLSQSSKSQQADDLVKIELQMLATDLRALALDPFHGEQRSCPAVIKQVFLKFRSLVYQKSLVPVPPTENEAIEGNSSRLLAPSNKASHKNVKVSARTNDPTKGGKKRGPSDWPEGVQKRKLDASQGVKSKVDDFLDTKKKMTENTKSLTVERKILRKSVESPRVDVKDSAARVVSPTTHLRSLKQESSKSTGQMVRAASPTILMMKFPAGAALPSIPQLKAKFARFGPLDQSATRVFWKTYMCRLVYQHKIDAQAALKFAIGSSNLFGNKNVKCYIREVEAETADPEAVKPQKENTSSQTIESAIEPRMVANAAASQPLQHLKSSEQLKSCLKKPSGGDDGVNGGGSGRSARVKFVLGREESIKVPLNENKKNASSIHSLDLSSTKILPNNNPQSSNTFAQSSSYSNPFQHQQMTTALETTLVENDVSGEMLNLLMRCNDVVSNLRVALGCMPYHPL